MFFRNPEIKKLLLILAIIAVVLVTVGFIIGTATGVIVLLTVVSLSTIYILNTAKRYKKIKELSSYLTRISNGDFSLDVRDNVEGELSILKSEIYKVTQKLVEYTETLEKEKVQLSDFLADISHQLKTPLTSMTLMCELLSDPDLPDEKRQEFIECIHSQLERIEWLVLSLLKMSRLDAGVVSMKQEEIEVMDLIDKALIPVSMDAELKDIDISISAENVMKIRCDIQWTCEALINILKNCVEHTAPKGSIKITAGENPIHYEITIEDNGSGIDKEDIPHVFTRFYKGKNASKDSVGIGLAMARSIIRNQNGDITLESKKNAGSKFTVRLYKMIV